jgi:hypothetical protein
VCEHAGRQLEVAFRIKKAWVVRKPPLGRRLVLRNQLSPHEPGGDSDGALSADTKTTTTGSHRSSIHNNSGIPSCFRTLILYFQRRMVYLGFVYCLLRSVS